MLIKVWVLGLGSSNSLNAKTKIFLSLVQVLKILQLTLFQVIRLIYLVRLFIGLSIGALEINTNNSLAKGLEVLQCSSPSEHQISSYFVQFTVTGTVNDDLTYVHLFSQPARGPCPAQSQRRNL